MQRNPVSELDLDRLYAALADVAAERTRQHARWGEQNHPLVPPASELVVCSRLGIISADESKIACDLAHRSGRGTYAHILVEEVAEAVEACAIHGETSDEARAELVQVAAVAVQMVERIDSARAAQNVAAPLTREGDHAE